MNNLMLIFIIDLENYKIKKYLLIKYYECYLI